MCTCHGCALVGQQYINALEGAWYTPVISSLIRLPTKKGLTFASPFISFGRKKTGVETGLLPTIYQDSESYGTK